MCIVGQVFDHKRAGVIELRLANLRSDHFFGDDFETMIAGKDLPPERELAIRELIILSSQKLKPSETTLS